MAVPRRTRRGATFAKFILNFNYFFEYFNIEYFLKIEQLNIEY